MNFVGTGVTGNGMILQPTSGNPNIVIMNTSASNNQYAGIYYAPPSGTATTGILIDRVSANNNSFGVLIDNSGSSGTAKADISNSIASFNLFYGFYFFNVTASLDASNASSNGADGVDAAGGPLALGRSVLMNNGAFGLLITGGVVSSYKDNRIAGNGSGPVSATPAAATLF